MALTERDRTIIEEIARRSRNIDTLEDLLVKPYGYGISTATPLQRAVCRLIDGIPLGPLKYHEHVKAAVGDISKIEGVRPKKVVICAGIRTFKSMIAAGVGALSPRRVDTSPMLSTEGARFAVASTSRDNARKVMMHATSLLRGKNKALQMLKDKPSADTLILPHPEKREFTFKVAAGSRAGSALVSDWSSGVVFDEAARMLSSDQGVINLDDAIDAVEGRLLPGAQMFLISSPWAPYGTFFDYVSRYHGRSDPDVLCIWAQGPWLNPVWWTEDRCLSLKTTNPDAFQTDVLAKFRSPEEGIFSDALIAASTRPSGSLPPQRGHTYQAAMDPGTRRNSWAFVLTTNSGGKVRVVLAKQWTGSSLHPLRPREIFQELAEILEPYGCSIIDTDQYSFDALADIAIDFGLYLNEVRLGAKEKTEAAGKIKTLMEDNRFDMPDDNELRGDMLRVIRRVTQTGVTLHLPLTSDGRHCDYIPALLLACKPYLIEDEKPEPEYGTREYWELQERLDIEHDIRQIESQAGDSTW